MFNRCQLTKNSWKLVNSSRKCWLYVKQMVIDIEFMETVNRYCNRGFPYCNKKIISICFLAYRCTPTASSTDGNWLIFLETTDNREYTDCMFGRRLLTNNPETIGNRGIHWLHVWQMITEFMELMDDRGCSENDYWRIIHGNWWKTGEYTDLHVQQMVNDKEIMETDGWQGNTLACMFSKW